MYILIIGGNVVQYGPTEKSLTLLGEYGLMYLSRYNNWILIDENGNSHELHNGRSWDNAPIPEKINEIDYFDGEKNNKLFVGNKMCCPKKKVVLPDNETIEYINNKFVIIKKTRA
jgi:hypothetical protein